ncbi:MAG: DUF1735 domain-containing protein [Bacteroides sp.]|nr:DUF1735 domain-containing protein [Bacteroides sp.]
MNYIKFAFYSLCFSGLLLTACEDDLTITTGNDSIFETVDGTYGSVRSAAGARQLTTISLRDNKAGTGHLYFELSKNAESSVQVSFKIDSDALTAYNEANGTDYEMYPTSSLSLENNGSVTIPAGSKKSESVELNINPSGTVGKTYAVAVSATADNGVEVSSNTQSYIYLVENLGVTPDPSEKGDIKNLVYVEVNNESLLNAGEYTVDGVPFFDIVSIFAANINLDSDGKPYIYCNDQVSYVLANADKIIRPLQQKGIKVHLSILGNHDDAGMRSLSDEGAKAFAKELKAYLDIYGLDGFDFDDEYSAYAENTYKGTSGGVVSSADECTPANYLKLLQACREEMPKEDGTTFGVYWYTSEDHPMGDEVEDVIDYAVFGSYGAFHAYYGQDIAAAVQAPYAISLTTSTDNMTKINVNNTYLDQVVEGGYKYFAFYNLGASRMYEPYFDKVADKLWGKDVTWSGKYYARTDLTANEGSVPTYESYLGDWTVTSATALYVYYDETDTPRWWDWTSAQTFDITIAEDVAGESYKVYGWDGKDITAEYPFILNYDDSGVAFCPSPQEIGTVDGVTYAMSRGTYSGGSWAAMGADEQAFVLETSLSGNSVYLYDSGQRYGLSLFTVDGDSYTAVESLRNPHSSGMYTLVKK